MNSFLRQSTASQTRTIGPFVDDTDFKTAETALTIANTDVKLMANGGTSANKNSGGGTHRVNGEYAFTFDATDSATVGELKVSIVVAGALPVFCTFVVLEEAVYDALFAASALGYVANAPVSVAQFGGVNGTFSGGRPEVNTSHIAGSAISQSAGVANVNVTQVSGDSVAADNAEAFFDGTGYAGTNNVIPTVSTLTNAPGDSSGVTTLLSRLSAVRAGYLDNLSAGAVALASTFSGITSLAQWLGLLAGKQTGDTTARTEIRATGAGSGTYNEVTDSLEAVRDRGDTAWITAVGFSTHSAAGAATAVRTELTTELGRIDAAITTRASQTSVDDLPTNAELATALGTADDATLAAISALDAKVGTPANLGGGATLAANLSDIEGQTDDIGVAGAGLTAVPWNAAWDAEVESEVTDALVALNLDHLLGTATGIPSVPSGTFWDQMLRDGTATYDRTTDSLQALRDRGDAAWTTVSAAAIRSAVGLAAANLDAQLTAIDDYIDTEIADILTDTSTTLDDLVDDLEARLTSALASKLAAHAAAVLTFTTTTGGTTTTVPLSTVEGTTPSAVDDFYNGAVLVFTSGALAGQRTSVSDYNGTTKVATVVALTSAPASGVSGVIV